MLKEYFSPLINTASENPAFEINNPNSEEESIFNYYSIKNEVDFINNKRLDENQKEYYLRENILRFLGEFAGKVPYTKITYVLRTDGLYYGDIKMSDVYKQTAQEAGDNSREMSEGIGFEKVEESFLRPFDDTNKPANTACWLSPPKTSDYGFVFYFVKDGEYDQRLKGYGISEYILRYQEKKGEIKNSNAISYAISDDADYFYRKTDDDFLKNPFRSSSYDKNQDTKKLFQAVGINDEEMEKSTLFEKIAEDQLSVWIDEYIKNIFAMSQMSPDSMEFQEGEDFAHYLITAIYNRAKEIKHITEEPENYFPASRQADSLVDNELLAYYAKQKPATVQGGGSCPTVKKQDNGFLSSFDVYSLIDKGLPPEKSLTDEKTHHDDYACPGCGKSLSGENKNDKSSWRKECEHCHTKLGCSN